MARHTVTTVTCDVCGKDEVVPLDEEYTGYIVRVLPNYDSYGSIAEWEFCESCIQTLREWIRLEHE